MKLLIIRSGALGDTLMLMPLINGLSELHQTIILGRKPGIDYLESFVEQCIDIERGGWHGLFSRGTDIDVTCPQADHVTAFINDKENIVSGNLNCLFPGSKIDIFPPFPDPDSHTHVALYMARALQSAGILFDSRMTFDSIFKKSVMQSNKYPGKKIVLHPGSGSMKKNYPPDFWFELLSLLKKAGISLDVCFLLGPAEEDIVTVTREMAEELDAGTVVCPEKEELLSILDNTYLYIGHDSGVTHLAAMLGINTIAIFKDSSIEQWRPLGPSVKIIEAEGDIRFILEKAVSEAVIFMDPVLLSP
ncbi:MAG: glycosyltransferase family 9 protein [Desulfobacteraceae bacterium]